MLFRSYCGGSILPYTVIMVRHWIHAIGVLFHFALEGEVPLRGPGRRVDWESVNGQTIFGGNN